VLEDVERVLEGVQLPGSQGLEVGGESLDPPRAS